MNILKLIYLYEEKTSQKVCQIIVCQENDPDCKCYDRDMERHRQHYIKTFWHFIRRCKKRDWYWYYYYQARSFNNLNHDDAIKLADKCIADYNTKWRKKNVCR